MNIWYLKEGNLLQTVHSFLVWETVELEEQSFRVYLNTNKYTQ